MYIYAKFLSHAHSMDWRRRLYKCMYMYMRWKLGMSSLRMEGYHKCNKTINKCVTNHLYSKKIRNLNIFFCFKGSSFTDRNLRTREDGWENETYHHAKNEVFITLAKSFFSVRSLALKNSKCLFYIPYFRPFYSLQTA